MALNIFQGTVLAARSAATSQFFRFEVAESYVRWIEVKTNAPTGLVSVRFTNMNNTLAPWPGLGLTDWLLMLSASYAWDEFKKLTGAPYEITVEAFNTDAQTAYILQVLVETSKFPFYPVNAIAAPDKPTHVQLTNIGGTA